MIVGANFHNISFSSELGRLLHNYLNTMNRGETEKTLENIVRAVINRRARTGKVVSLYSECLANGSFAAHRADRFRHKGELAKQTY